MAVVSSRKVVKSFDGPAASGRHGVWHFKRWAMSPTPRRWGGRGYRQWRSPGWSVQRVDGVVPDDRAGVATNSNHVSVTESCRPAVLAIDIGGEFPTSHVLSLTVLLRDMHGLRCKKNRWPIGTSVAAP